MPLHTSHCLLVTLPAMQDFPIEDPGLGQTNTKQYPSYIYG